MKIVCAASVLFAKEAFETLGETVVIPDRLIGPDDLRQADALIVRSKTNVDQRLLARSHVGFVGTATAGYDHIDIDYLRERDIAWCAAPGCNANSVAEYVVTALCCLANRHHLTLDRRVLGVIGCGQVGSRVVEKTRSLGMNALRNDPPLEIATEDSGFVSIEDVLHQADAITLHVPLTKSGQFPTYRMVDSHFFEHLKPGCIFLNTARGEIVDSEMLLFALHHGAPAHAVLDVWQSEPFLSEQLIEKVDLATPHIAGYSFEGRLGGTAAVYREACNFFEIQPKWTPNEGLFPKSAEITLDARGKSDESVLYEAARAAYEIEGDDKALRQGSKTDDAARASHFDMLRRQYPDRREFTAVRVKLLNATTIQAKKLAGLGFRVS